ncbi:MAG: ATP-binding protein [Candidatus Sericytochromatia bacterium]
MSDAPHFPAPPDPESSPAMRAALLRITRLNEISRLIEQTLDLEEMIQRVVAKLLEIFEADRAYMLYPCNPDAPSITVPIEYTRPEYPGSFELNTPIPMNPGGAQVMRDALEAGGPVVYGPQRPFPMDEGVLAHFQVQSQLDIAIRPKIGEPWLLGLHQCAHPRVWTADEQALMQDIALRLADAFSNVLFHQELKRSEQRYRTVLDNIREAVLQLDASGAIAYHNPAWTTMTQDCPPPPPGAKFVDWLHPDDRQRAQRILAAPDEDPDAFEARLLSNGAGPRWVEIHAQATTRSPGESMTVTLRDITDRKLAEQARQELAAAREIDRLKTIFVHAISHDLRTPLTSALGYAEFLEEELGGPLAPQQHLYVQEIRRAVHRMEYMVDDMLDLARLEAGSFELREEPSDLGAMVTEVLASLQPQAAAGGLSLEASLPSEPVLARLDRSRTERVLINLITNALKFTPADGAVRVVVQVGPDDVRVEVRDSGPGIAADEVPMLFQRFSQLDTGKRKGGLGLGLSISKAIIEGHGGRIGVETALGAGSTFWFTLPRSRLIS